jgi:hypothetical protein
MKHQSLYLATIFFAILAFAGSCKKSELSFESPGGNPGPGKTVTFSISGKVVDENNAPVNQAEVKAGTATTRTDANGNFRFTNISLSQKAAYITVNKTGYFPGSRTFVAHEKAVNYVSIRLIEKELTGSFPSAGGGAVTLPSGGSINFQPNSVVDAATNSAYSGTVNVSAYFIDPSKPGFINEMPGDLRGITTGGEERGLQSFGMMAVELTGTGGQKLQLVSGKPATMNFAIPASLLASAPATIPLWSFDEVTGLWKEEGSATRQGNNYVGTVTHFSFWNCDAPFPLVSFEAVVKDQKGHPVPNVTVTIKKLNNSSFGAAITDELGRVSGLIPAGEALELKITDRCGNVLFTTNIGPYNSNVNYGNIIITMQPPATVVITGTAVNCNNTALTNGFVNINLDGFSYRVTVNNGSFTISIIRCTADPAQAQIFAEDIAAGQQGAIQLLPVTSGNANAGQLTACGTTTDQFVNYTLNGVNYAFTSPNDSFSWFKIDSISFQSNYLRTMNANQTSYLSIYYYGGTTTGSFTGDLGIENGSNKYEGTGVSIVITQYGNIGQFITGTFAGNVLLGGTGSPIPATGSFKVRRTQ